VVSGWEFIGQPNAGDLGSRLIVALADQHWTRLDAAVAFVKMSGVAHLAPSLYGFATRNQVRIAVGIDQQGTSLEGLQTLWLVLGGAASELYVLQNPAGNPSPTFHPKLWLFRSETDALLICGSGNLTGGGLFTNYEAGVVLPLALDDPTLRAVVDVLDQWSDESGPEVAKVTAASMQAMHDVGELPSEPATQLATRLSRTAKAMIAGVGRGVRASSGLFRPAPVRPAPPTPMQPVLPAPPVTPRPVPRLSAGRPTQADGARPAARHSRPPPGEPPVVPSTDLVPLHDQLLIVVNPRQRTEIYLAKAPLQDDPAFFGWPFLGRTTPRGSGNSGQPQPDPLPTADVTVYDAAGSVAGSIHDPSLKLWTYSFGASANDDFRMTLTGGLLRLVPDESVLVMTRQPVNGSDYTIEIYPPGHPHYATLLAACSETLPGGRRYGWK
jgi:hypothetical protein